MVEPRYTHTDAMHRTRAGVEGRLEAGDIVLLDGRTLEEAIADQTYVHIQLAALADWTIDHFMGRAPSVVVIDSAGTTVLGDVEYVDDDHLVLHFTVAFSGTAYLN
jgi:hypothetical protein